MKTILLKALIITVVGLVTCGTTYGQTGAAWEATLQKKIAGFNVPECMVVDPRSGQVFVSNIEALEDQYWADDGKGFISLLARDGTVEKLRWKDSTKAAVINSPKGMCILKDHLYFTDNARLMKVALSGKGKPSEIKVPGAVRLNDSATDGKNIWVTDTGAGLIYRVDSQEHVHRVAEIKAVNGVTCDKGKVFAVSWELHELFEVFTDGRRGQTAPFGLAEHFTNLDGIEVLKDGSFVVSDFKGNKVSLISPDRKTVRTLIQIESPADIGINRKRGLLYVPSFMTNQVAVYSLKSTKVRSRRDPIRGQNAQVVKCRTWPLDVDQARRQQTAAGRVTQKTVDLGNGVKMQMTLIPAGEFVMGSLTGATDERPLSSVRIERPFWIGACEVTNRQFNVYDSDHDSRVESKNTYQFGIHGYPVNRPEQPVVRVAWEEANAFCRWLSDKTDRNFTLPTEAQWEYACRAGTDTPFFFGDRDSDFSKFANMADAKLSEFASDPYTVNRPLENPSKYDDWIPKDSRFNDGSLLSVAPRGYQSNAWGVFDSHGNVGEWTRSTYLPYPHVTTDGRDDDNRSGEK